MKQLEQIKKAIMADPQNKDYTNKGIEPLFAAPKTARINISDRLLASRLKKRAFIGKTRAGTA